MKPIYWLLVIILIAVPVYILFNRSAVPQPTPPPTPTSEPENVDSSIIQLDNLEAGSTVSSPLTITGTVPPGWMFEASFPITLFDDNGEIITQSYGEPIPPDDWMSGEPVRFTATLTFETDAESGFIRFEKDNPSGLPENAESYDVAVNF